MAVLKFWSDKEQKYLPVVGGKLQYQLDMSEYSNTTQIHKMLENYVDIETFNNTIKTLDKSNLNIVISKTEPSDKDALWIRPKE